MQSSEHSKQRDELAETLLQYVLQGNSESFSKLIESTLANKTDSEDHDLDYIFNTWQADKKYWNSPLIVLAAKENNFQIVETILKYKVCTHSLFVTTFDSILICPHILMYIDAWQKT